MTVQTKLFVGLVGLLVLCVVALFAPRLFPSTLRVRIDSALPWKSVAVASPNLAMPRYFDFDAPVDVRPLQHGLYTVRILFFEGRIASFEFVHTDAGDCRWLDLDVSRSAIPDAVRIRAASNKWFLPRQVPLFDGDVHLTDSNQTTPQWIFGP